MAFNWRKFPWTNLHDLNLDWIIQTVKTLEDNLTDAVGKFTEIANAAVGAERTERRAGDAALQTEIENGVYPTISRNINEVNTSINTERTERIAGDAALQSTIDNVIMPIITKGSAGIYALVINSDSIEDGTSVTLTAEQTSKLRDAVQSDKPMVLIVKSSDGGANVYTEISADLNYGISFCQVGSVTDTGAHYLAIADPSESGGSVMFLTQQPDVYNYMPFSLSVMWINQSSPYTLTDAEYALLRSALLDKRPIFVVCNDADINGTQNTYILYSCTTPSGNNVDSMSLTLRGSPGAIMINMADKTISTVLT